MTKRQMRSFERSKLPDSTNDPIEWRKYCEQAAAYLAAEAAAEIAKDPEYYAAASHDAAAKVFPPIRVTD